MGKLLITADSTADLDYFYKERGIICLPLAITLGDKTGYDTIDVTPQTIYDFYEETKTTPKTAALSPEEYYKFFKTHTEGGNELIHFTISSAMSSCYENACRAATECGGVRVVDSKNLSTGIGILALYADDLRKQGTLTTEEIYRKILDRVNDVSTSFVVDTLEFLAKGGRCNGALAFFASIIKLKPEINVKDGVMNVGKKYIGKSSVTIMKYIKSTIENNPDMDKKHVFITHTNADKKTVDEVMAYVKEKLPGANIYETIAGSTVTSHCGKGTLGLICFKHEEK